MYPQNSNNPVLETHNYLINECGAKPIEWGNQDESLYAFDDMLIYRENNRYSIIDLQEGI